MASDQDIVYAISNGAIGEEVFQVGVFTYSLLLTVIDDQIASSANSSETA